MIQAAFRPEWWLSSAIVTYDASGAPHITLPARVISRAKSGRSDHPGGGQGGAGGSSGGSSAGAGSSNSTPASLSTDQYTVMESNFSLFFGLSIQLYLSTLVSDDTPFDRSQGGQVDALTSQQRAGFQLFFGKAGCARCHVGPEFTEASYAQCASGPVDDLTTLSGVEAKYDKGFLNTGVRPVANDLGIGGTEPFGYPLADTRCLQMGQLSPGTFNEDVGAQEAVVVDGAFKVPGLRNVELTAPYFHNGGMATLEQVVAFYNRGGDFARQGAATIRDFMRPLGLSADEQAALVAFLKSLTDDRVRFQKAPSTTRRSSTRMATRATRGR